jgi:hypothetical protein
VKRIPPDRFQVDLPDGECGLEREAVLHVLGLSSARRGDHLALAAGDHRVKHRWMAALSAAAQVDVKPRPIVARRYQSD